MTELVARNVCALLTIGLDMVLAVGRRKKPGYFGMPGGKIDPGEDPRAALKREMKEETGLDVLVALEPFHVGADETGEINATYRVTVLGAVPQGRYIGPEGTPVEPVLWEVLTSASTCEFAQYNRDILVLMQAEAASKDTPHAIAARAAADGVPQSFTDFVVELGGRLLQARQVITQLQGIAQQGVLRSLSDTARAKLESLLDREATIAAMAEMLQGAPVLSGLRERQLAWAKPSTELSPELYQAVAQLYDNFVAPSASLVSGGGAVLPADALAALGEVKPFMDLTASSK